MKRLSSSVPGCLLLAACTAAPATALTSVPRNGQLAPGDDIYSMPFPTDFYRSDAGLDLSLFPRPSPLMEEYVDTMGSRLDGWGRNAAMFARFDGELDASSLPATPEDSLADDASVYLVDVDPASPEKGTKWPLRYRFEPKAGEAIGSDWLSALPYPGFPLGEGRTYALVMTNRLRSAGGGDVQPDDDWVAVRDGTATDADLVKLQTADQPLLDWLDESGGDEREDVVSAAVFTTQRSTDIYPLLRQRVRSLDPPVVQDITFLGNPEMPDADYRFYDAHYLGPNFQTGNVPYLAQGGEIQLDPDDGLPIVQRTEDLRLSFTIPTGEMPANGWPIVIYAHGTGGSYHSYVNDGTARRLAKVGMAAISIDQVLNAVRNPGGDPDVAFFNFQNPLAARDNAVQGAADDFTVARIVEALDYTDPDAGEIKFDPTKIYFFGHSQGGLTGPPFVAFEPDIQGAVLSGAGAVLYLGMLYKTEPVDISQLLSAVFRDEPLDEFNNQLALLQTWIERADPVNYGPLLVREPAEGMVPRPIFQSEGLIDSYAPPQTIEAFATAIGEDLVAPVLQDVEGIHLRGRTTLDAPTSDNLDGTTAVLLQYDQAAGSDGHFVVFDIPAAQKQSIDFLATLNDTGTATVVAP
jgi:dienelactone hydrolase